MVVSVFPRNGDLDGSLFGFRFGSLLKPNTRRPAVQRGGFPGEELGSKDPWLAGGEPFPDLLRGRL